MTNIPQENQIIDLFNQEPESTDPAQSDRPVSDLAPMQAQNFNSSSPAMLLQSLQITNLWSYDQTEIDFQDGITVIAGMNGSGKSSLLESIFFALYGSKAGPAMDRSLVDVLRIGTDLGFVTLKFQYGNHHYTAQMALRRRGDKVISEKEACELHRDDGEKWVGVDVITQEIENLFGMNRDDFTNCVYVRQGEIDRLIRAGGKDRRDMIDRLLRLEKLDKYAKRSEDGARRAVNRYADQLNQRSGDLRNEVKRIENDQPEKQLGELETAIKTHQSELKAIETKIEQANALKQQHDVERKQVEDSQRELKSLHDSIEKKEKQLNEQEVRSNEITQSLDSLKALYTLKSDQFKEIVESLKLPLSEVTSQLEIAKSWDEIELLASQLIDAKTRQAEIQERAEKLQSEGNLASEKASTELLELAKEITQAETQLSTLKQEHQKICDLVEQGKCPDCGQLVNDGDFSKKILAKQEDITELEAIFVSKQDEASTKNEAIAAKKNENEDQISRLREEYRVLDQRTRLVDQAKDLAQQMLQSKREGEQQREAQKAQIEMMESTREDLAMLKLKLSEQSQKSQNVAELEEKLKKIEQVLVQLQSQRAELQRKNEAMLNERGVLQNKLEQLVHLQKEIDKASGELENAQNIQAELLQLSEFYGSLKKELRMQNIEALEHYFNAFFHVMDSGASYSGVKISPEYEIVVELKSGDYIKPELLSGGERALINIALRSAIHQVLSQATSRMPLILDEPTIYLDRDRVTRLQYLLEELGSRIGQVIVVSHEVGLVEGADHEYRTEKRADNTSHVYQVR